MKIDISHSKAFENLKNGTGETIDFTGHELGDAGVAFLYDYLCENKVMTSLNPYFINRKIF